MRALLCLVVLAVSLAGAAWAAEPGTWHFTLNLQGVSQQDCVQRGRDAMTAQQIRLAETTANSQYGVQGDYLALVVCAAAQPTVMFMVVAGPQSAQAQQIAQRMRATVTGAAPPPVSK